MNTRIFITLSNISWLILAFGRWDTDWYIGVSLIYLAIGSGMFHWNRAAFWRSADKSAMYVLFFAIGFFWIDQRIGFDEWRVAAFAAGVISTIWVDKIPTFLMTGITAGFALAACWWAAGFEQFFGGASHLAIAFAIRQTGHEISHRNLFHGIWHIVAANGIRIITLT